MTPTPVTPVVAKSAVERAIAYVKTEWERVVAYGITEAAALLTLAHTQSTSFEHEIAVAGAAALAAAINKARQSHLIP